VKVLEKSTLIFEIPFKHSVGYAEEASAPKTSLICFAVFVQCRLVTEMGWFG